MSMLRTSRLLLRRWRKEDIDQLSMINADPDVMRFIGDGSVADRDRTAAEIMAFERLWEREGFGRFAVELLETGELVGFAGMAIPDDVPEIMPTVEIGWRLARAQWGRGIATEAARAALRHAFDQAGLDRIVAVHVIGNTASERVMEKLGMRPVLDTVETVYRRPVRVHAISRPDPPLPA